MLGETDLSNLASPYLAWTPDSKWIVYPDAAVPGLFMLSVQTGEERRLTERGDTHPAFSPDGRTLAFSHGGTDIYVLRLAAGYVPLGAPEKLASVGDTWVGLAWSPDGGEIVFTQGTWMSSDLCEHPGSDPENAIFGGT